MRRGRPPLLTPAAVRLLRRQHGKPRRERIPLKRLSKLWGPSVSALEQAGRGDTYRWVQ